MQGRLSLVGKGKLILKVIKAVVDGRGREHQHFGLNHLLDDPVHEPLVTG